MTLFRDNPELLATFRRGEKEALRIVYDFYAREIADLLIHGFYFSSQNQTFRFAGFRSPCDVQDALQETFSRAFRPAALSSYDETRPYWPYLRQIARNYVINTSRNREEVDDKIVTRVERGSDAVRSPEEHLISRELKQLYWTFVNQLSEIQRQVVELRFEQSLSRREVCRHTGISPMALRTLEKRIKTAYAEFLIHSGYITDLSEPFRMKVET